MRTISSEVVPIRVLMVEDEILISEWVAETLEELGFAVYCAANAADALRYLASAPVDVLFTDVNLPGGMDGTALARRARELSPGLSVVYASARVMLDAKLRVPDSMFVPKPYVPALVGRLIANSVKTNVAHVPA
jgi:CheY-like chemotaxis protein